MPLRIAAATEDLHSSLKSAIGIAAGLEIDGVRLNTRSELNVTHSSDSALRQTQLYVTERQIKVAGLFCPTKHALYEEPYLEERVDVIRRSMSLVRKLGTSELLIRCGPVPDPEDRTGDLSEAEEPENPFSFSSPRPAPGKSPAEQFSLLCEILSDLARHGNHVGCILCVQSASCNPKLLKMLVDGVKSGPVKITFDPATAVMTGSDPVQIYRDLHEHIGYVRARDAVRNADGGGIEAAVGHGIVDWVSLIPTVLESDYSGWVCVERTGGDSRAEDVTRGVTILGRLLPQTGS